MTESKFYMIEWEGDPIPVREFYEEGDNVVILDRELKQKGKERPATIALDFDEEEIYLQFTDNYETACLPLEYTRKHARLMWDLYWNYRLEGVK